jgi:signal transduction histidine kinase
VGSRDVAGAALAAAGVLGGVLLAPTVEPDSGVAAAVAGPLALGVAVSWPRARNWIACPAAVAAATSLATTIYVLVAGRQGTGTSGTIGFVEVAGLLVLLALVVRWAPARTAVAVGAAATLATCVWILRYLPSYDLLAIVGGCASMAVATAFAIVVGGYPRLAQARLSWSVRSARQAQRLEIAHDLHDYVAHDLTGIVAQAQAARYTCAGDPVRLVTALERIEAIGLQALSTMDDMVGVLRDDSAAPTHPIARMSDVPDLVERFSSERGPSCRVDLDQDPRVADAGVTPLPAQATAHRVVVEALTNVRRHAPQARRVTISARVRDAEEELVVTVTNDRGAGTPPPRPTPGGHGLASLRQRVRALGGVLTAGPDTHGGWVVQAHVPMRPLPGGDRG